MKRAITLPALVVALIVAGSATADAAKTVKASAKFSAQLADQSGKYEFGQSKIVKSQLDWTPQVPVSLHAAPKAEPFQEFSLSGRVEKGTQKTSEAVVVGISVDVGNQSMLLVSDDGGCTVKVTTLTKSRISGSFTCDTTYGDQPLKAEGHLQGAVGGYAGGRRPKASWAARRTIRTGVDGGVSGGNADSSISGTNSAPPPLPYTYTGYAAIDSIVDMPLWYGFRKPGIGPTSPCTASGSAGAPNQWRALRSIGERKGSGRPGVAQHHAVDGERVPSRVHPQRRRRRAAAHHAEGPVGRLLVRVDEREVGLERVDHHHHRRPVVHLPVGEQDLILPLAQPLERRQ